MVKIDIILLHISKGIIYHYFKDKNELYLLCVEECFREVTAYLQEHTASSDGPAGKRLQDYFNARLRFFAENPLYLVQRDNMPAQSRTPEDSGRGGFSASPA